jgi:hypothetical protein
VIVAEGTKSCAYGPREAHCYDSIRLHPLHLATNSCTSKGNTLHNWATALSTSEKSFAIEYFSRGVRLDLRLGSATRGTNFEFCRKDISDNAQKAFTFSSRPHQSRIIFSCFTPAIGHFLIVFSSQHLRGRKAGLFVRSLPTSS